MRLIRENKTSPEEIAIVNMQVSSFDYSATRFRLTKPQLGEFTGDAIIQFAQEQGFSLEDEVDIIAGQGQTIWHLPLPELFEGDQIRAHLDMAEISVIAARTGITSLSAFRVGGKS
jgi:1,6-anhydro-N-acetylmuramate kinase